MTPQRDLDRHLDRTVRNWLGLPHDAAIEAPRLPPELTRRLLRVEETEQITRDQWGCWEPPSFVDQRSGKLWEPEVDTWIAARRQELGRRTQLEPLWPEGRPFVVCLTHDVDMVTRAQSPVQVWRSIRASATPGTAALGREAALRLLGPVRAVARAARHGVSCTPTTANSLERCVAVEAELGVRGSYFFVVHPPPLRSRYDCAYALDDMCRFRGRMCRVAEVIVRLAEEGFDVGLHGSYHSATVSDVLAQERAGLERATGLTITTTRQHYLHWDVAVTPRLQREAGFTADTTAGFNRHVGFRCGTTLPFFMWDLARSRPIDLLEVPLVIQDGALLRVDGLGLQPLEARSVLEQFFDTIAAVHGVVTLLFHPHTLVDPEVHGLLRWCIENAMRRGAWVTSLKSIDSWWRARDARLSATSP